jgi:hypothetical protein
MIGHLTCNSSPSNNEKRTQNEEHRKSGKRVEIEWKMQNFHSLKSTKHDYLKFSKFEEITESQIQSSFL